MTQGLRIRLLGTFEVERDGEILPEAAWHTQQAKQVLKILLLARGRPVASERLMEWLWPGGNLTATATTLRSTVHALRRALEPDRPPRAPSRYVVTRSPGYAFEPDQDTWVDLYAFEDLLDQIARTRHPGHKRRLLTQALDLYRGDLLEEDPYADWAILERERLRHRYLDALLELAELHANAGELDRAIAACRRALARDEFREPIYRALMRYQVLAGDVAAALSTYERCRQMLTNEFGAEPAPQTQALYQAILRGEVPIPARPMAQASSTPLALAPEPSLLPPLDAPFGDVLVGREDERDRLTGHLEQVVRGRGGIVAVTGDAGMGKTHLVLATLRSLANSRVSVLGTRCLATERALPFAPLTGALRRLLDTLSPTCLAELPPFALAQVAQLLPALHYSVPDLPAVPDTTPEENRGRLIDGVANLIIALSDQTPLVIFLDDVQWADEATLTTLGRLAYRAARHPLLLIVTYPPDALAENPDLHTVITHLAHDGLLNEITLGALTLTDVIRFVSLAWQRGEEEVTDLARHLHERTEGVPLYLVEVVREALSRSDTLPRPEDIPPVQGLAHVRTLILTRVSRLPQQARDVLHLAAVIGRAFPLDLLETAALSDPLPGLEVLLQRHFLREDGPGRLAFTHDVVRQVVYQALSPLARRRLHQQVADALVALHGPGPGSHAVAVAYHYRQAGARFTLPALRYAVLAGDHLRRVYGFRQASAHYRQALQLMSQVPPDDQAPTWVRRAYLGLGLACEALADWEGIVTTYTELRRWAEAQGDVDLSHQAARRLMVALTVIGRLDEAAVMAGDVLAAAGEEEETPLAEIFTRLRVVFGTGAVEGGTSGHTWPPYHRSPGVVGTPWVEATEVLGQELAPLPLGLYGWSLALQGHLDAAEACLRHAAHLAQATAQIPYQVMASHILAHVAFMRGDAEAIQEHLDRGFRLARQAPEAEWSTIWARLFEAYIHLHSGNVSSARQRFSALDRGLTGRSAFRSHHLSAWVGLALVALAEGRTEDALALLDQVLAQSQNLDVVSYFWAQVGEASIARRQGDLDRAGRLVQRTLAFAGERGLLFEYVAAAEEAARYAAARGTPEVAVPLLRDVVMLTENSPARGAAQAAREALARLMQVRGRGTDLSLESGTTGAERKRNARQVQKPEPGGKPTMAR